MIKARIKAENPEANMKSYIQAYQSFSWFEVEKAFTWHQTKKINIVHEAVDRWADQPDTQNRKALIFERDGDVKTFTYLDLKKKSSQWANFLIEKGFKTGDRLFIFLPPCPEIYLAMLACGRLGVLFSVLFSSLNFDDLEVRLRSAEPLGILTNPDLVESIPYNSIQRVKHLLLTEGQLPGLYPGEVLLENLPYRMPEQSKIKWLSRRMPLYLNYTSGSTGTPKGVVHTHHDMVGILATTRSVLDLNEDDILWTEAEPAWVTGTVYSVFAPWLVGATTFVQGDPFSASNLYRTLEKHRISVWYTTPTTIRRLIRAGDDLPGRYEFSNLRHIATVGEPLVPDLFYWIKKTLNLSPHDTWWMTETGIICLANFLSMDIKPGSMGKPVPGIEAAILDEEGNPLPPMSMGELALKVPWPGLMSGLWRDEDRYQEYFRVKGWFLTGDMAMKDEEGYYYHQGRNDDLIKVGGDKVIGPYEVEQVLSMHPAVQEAAVISKGGDPGTGTSFVKAFIRISENFAPSDRLSHEIKAFVRTNLSSDIVVKEIAFLDKIPKTTSGKVLRRVLRAGELGLPGGDLNRLKE